MAKIQFGQNFHFEFVLCETQADKGFVFVRIQSIDIAFGGVLMSCFDLYSFVYLLFLRLTPSV